MHIVESLDEDKHIFVVMFYSLILSKEENGCFFVDVYISLAESKENEKM